MEETKPNDSHSSEFHETIPPGGLTYFEIVIPEHAPEQVIRESQRLKGIVACSNLIKIVAWENSQTEVTTKQLNQDYQTGRGIPLVISRIKRLTDLMWFLTTEANVGDFVALRPVEFFLALDRLHPLLGGDAGPELIAFLQSEADTHSQINEAEKEVIELSDEDKTRIFDRILERVLSDLAEEEKGLVFRDQKGQPVGYRYQQLQSLDLDEIDNWRELLRAASHDLRTPVTPLHGYDQMFRRALSRNQEFDLIGRAAQMVNDSFNQLVLIAEDGTADVFRPQAELEQKSRSELSKVELQRYPECSLRDLDDILSRRILTLLHSRNVAVHIPRIQPNEIHYGISPVELLRMLNNMAQNSADEQSTQVWISAVPTLDRLEIRIDDDGNGLRQKIIDNQELPEGESTHGGAGIGTARMMRRLKDRRNVSFIFADNEHGGASIAMRIPAISFKA